MPKRAADEQPEEAFWTSPAKRPRDLNCTPAKSTPARSTSSVFSTPYTPYSVPSDSPTNPFGFKRRSQKLTLPKPTSFGKHLPLRFQCIKSPHLRAPPRRSGSLVFGNDYKSEGTYSVVQVPLSYSFRLLRQLILFLFNGDPTLPPPPRPEDGHLFEVQDKVTVYPSYAKPGQIKQGRTWAKLSSVRDPYYSAQSIMDLVANAEKVEAGCGLDEEDMEGGEWRWEAEEDFSLKHAFPDGPNYRRGIVYHHDRNTIIHITVCTQDLPGRKGVSNRPFLFRAFGDIHLDPPPNPPLASRLPKPRPRITRIFPRVPPAASSSSTVVDVDVDVGKASPRKRVAGVDADVKPGGSPRKAAAPIAIPTVRAKMKGREGQRDRDRAERVEKPTPIFRPKKRKVVGEIIADAGGGGDENADVTKPSKPTIFGIKPSTALSIPIAGPSRPSVPLHATAKLKPRVPHPEDAEAAAARLLAEEEAREQARRDKIIRDEETRWMREGSHDPRPYNKNDAFERFISLAYIPPVSCSQPYSTDDDDHADTHTDRIRAPPSPSSSSPSRSFDSDRSMMSTISMTSSYGSSPYRMPQPQKYQHQYMLPAETPVPDTALTRLRVERVGRRLERLAESGWKEVQEVCKPDYDDEEEGEGEEQEGEGEGGEGERYDEDGFWEGDGEGGGRGRDDGGEEGGGEAEGGEEDAEGEEDGGDWRTWDSGYGDGEEEEV